MEREAGLLRHTLHRSDLHAAVLCATRRSLVVTHWIGRTFSFGRNAIGRNALAGQIRLDACRALPGKHLVGRFIPAVVRIAYNRQVRLFVFRSKFPNGLQLPGDRRFQICRAGIEGDAFSSSGLVRKRPSSTSTLAPERPWQRMQVPAQLLCSPLAFPDMQVRRHIPAPPKRASRSPYASTAHSRSLRFSRMRPLYIR